MTFLLGLASSLLAHALEPCGTPEKFSLPVPARPTVPALPPGSSKDERDAFESNYPNTLTTPNFIFKWGDNVDVDPDAVQRLADGFEEAWAIEVIDMAHPAPTGTTTYLFNVYIGDTGDGTPSSGGAGGWFWWDDDGYPMIVVAAASLDEPDYADVVAPHEFYHAIQGATDHFQSNTGLWFWEATATWMAGQVLPTNPWVGMFVSGYVLYPDLPLDYYGEGGGGSSVHQYGAFLFPTFLTEYATDYTVVRDTWLAGGLDPLETLGNELAYRSLVLEEVWLDQLAHTILWDYDRGDDYAFWFDTYGGEPAGSEGMIAAESSADGVWHDGPSDVRPRRYGSNAIQLQDLVDGEITVEVRGDDAGSDGSPASFGARLVRRISGAPTEYVQLAFVGSVGSATIDIEEANQLFLVVGAWSLDRENDETFVYEYKATAVAAPEDTGGEDDTGGGGGGTDGGVDGGTEGDAGDAGDEGDGLDTGDAAAGEDGEPPQGRCGCAATGRGSAPWLTLAALLVVRRRRA